MSAVGVRLRLFMWKVRMENRKKSDFWLKLRTATLEHLKSARCSCKCRLQPWSICCYFRHSPCSPRKFHGRSLLRGEPIHIVSIKFKKNTFPNFYLASTCSAYIKTDGKNHLKDCPIQQQASGGAEEGEMSIVWMLLSVPKSARISSDSIHCIQRRFL